MIVGRNIWQCNLFLTFMIYSRKLDYLYGCAHMKF
ncbi:hypothetical protein Ccrd_024140 [Cynara cardunculus var. scolymus]|uniref:Uncharacterized protein n=1 Tax=Cynara cardunculus var. scolymus TaxID=59895 RepID=A0A103XCX0_CYNCS|nr:hypothetical protein Ccrd_024140 [Cynara cardunculus var. scolymus]